MIRSGLTVILLTLAAAPLAPVAAQDLLWVRQAGTTSSEQDYGARVIEVRSRAIEVCSETSMFFRFQESDPSLKQTSTARSNQAVRCPLAACVPHARAMVAGGSASTTC